jgi:hypothetical protein
MNIESTKPSLFSLFPCLGALLLAPCGCGLASQQTHRPPCASQSASMRMQQEERDEPRLTVPEGLDAWALAITTAGAITGNGAGGVTITSRGDAVVGPFGPGAKFMAAPADLQRLLAAVLTSKPDNWLACYAKADVAKGMEGCCDQLLYTLSMVIRRADGQEHSYRTFWYDDAESLLPQDLCGIYQAASSTKNAPNKTTVVQEALKQIAAGRGDPTPLAVTFDDLHGLWGGLRLTIHGTGQVDQTAVREQVGQPRKVYRKELDLLAALLVRQAAWEQRIPERTARPDESRAYLTIEYGTVSTVIWEWYNDLEQNRRISEMRDFMKKIAWNHSGNRVAGLTRPPELRAAR